MDKSHKILQNLSLICFKWGNTKILKHSLESKLFKISSKLFKQSGLGVPLCVVLFKVQLK